MSQNEPTTIYSSSENESTLNTQLPRRSHLNFINIVVRFHKILYQIVLQEYLITRQR